MNRNSTVIIHRICLTGTLAVMSLTVPAWASITLGGAGDVVAPDGGLDIQPGTGFSSAAVIRGPNASNVNLTSPAGASRDVVGDGFSAGAPGGAEAGAVRIMNDGEAGLGRSDNGRSELDLLKKNIEPDALKVHPQKIDASTFTGGPSFDDTRLTRPKSNTGSSLFGDKDEDNF